MTKRRFSFRHYLSHEIGVGIGMKKKTENPISIAISISMKYEGVGTPRILGGDGVGPLMIRRYRDKNRKIHRDESP